MTNITMVIIFDGEQYQPSVLGFYRQTQSKKQSKTQNINIIYQATSMDNNKYVTPGKLLPFDISLASKLQ